MELKETDINKITQMGMLAYPPEKMVNVLDVKEQDYNAFFDGFNNPDHAIHRAYQKGVDKADFAIDMALFKEAQAGNLSAIKEFQKAKRIRINKQR